MHPTKKRARVAGLLYLLTVITGLFDVMYVPSRLIVRGDSAATVNNILVHQSLYRIDLAVGLASTIIFMFLAFALYNLLKEVNQQHATLMVILVLIQVPQTFVTELIQMGTFVLVRGADFLSIIDKPQRDALAMLLIHLNGQGTILSEIFWGLWLFPLGLLVFRSGFLPRILGVWLIINGVAYVAMSFTGLLLPQYMDIVSRITFPALLGEVALMLWLLIMGAKVQPSAAPAL